MKLIIEPTDGVAPLLAAIKSAKKSVEIAIFRFDRNDVETALKAAAAQGRQGDRLDRICQPRRRTTPAQAGAALPRRRHHRGSHVERPDPLSRQVHPDRSPCPVRAVVQFHAPGHRPQPRLRHRDHHANWVREAVRLFRADCTRTKYAPKTETFVVSPANSRKVLGTFLKRAKKQLLIYDPKISDKEMLRILQERGESGRRDQGHRLGGWARPVRRAETGWHTAAHAHDHPRPAPGLRRQPEPSRRGTGLAPRTRPDCSGCEGREDTDRYI